MLIWRWRMGGIVVGMWAIKNNILFIEFAGATIVSRGGRLYVRCRDEYAEVEATTRIIVGSGFGFVITGDAIGVCVRRHIEVIVTDVTQSFTAIYAPYAPCLSNRASLKIRARQFAALADAQRRLRIAKDVVRRKVIAEHHEKAVQTVFLDDLGACRTVTDVRHIEAKTAQVWWSRWKDFELRFAKGFKPPVQWKSFKTRYIGRVQGKSGELPKQFTARFAETPLQALHNFAVGVVVARITQVVAGRGLDPCFGFLHDGRKPGRYSLTWDVVEVFRPILAVAVFEYARKKVFERADFVLQSGVVRLSSWIARECAAVACQAVSLMMMVREVRQIERVL
jgi:CRISPR/Cas system-associated endonuclease Cas1